MRVLLVALCLLGCKDKKPASESSGAGAPTAPAKAEESANEEEAPKPPSGEVLTAAAEEATGAANAAGIKEEDMGALAKVDWTERKRVPHEVVVEKIAVTLEVPEGLPRDSRTGDWNVSHPAVVEVPKVVLSTMEVSRVENLERAQYHATLSARTKTWVRGDKRDDGWRLTNAEPDKTQIEAIVYLRAGDVFVRCKASQMTEAPIPNFEKARAMLEAICDSMKLK